MKPNTKPKRESESTGRRKRKVKRPFAIEYRVKPGHWLVRLGTSNNWRICNRYAKEEDRDKALRALNRVPWMEYRAKV